MNERLSLLSGQTGSASLSHDDIEETPTSARDAPSPPPPPPPLCPESPSGQDSDYEELPFTEDEVWDASVYWVKSRPLDDVKKISFIDRRGDSLVLGREGEGGREGGKEELEKS